MPCVVDVFDNLLFVSVVFFPFTSFHLLFMSFAFVGVGFTSYADVSYCGSSAFMLLFVFFGSKGDTVGSNRFVYFVCCTDIHMCQHICSQVCKLSINLHKAWSRAVCVSL